MLFSEVYGTYYHMLSLLLQQAVEGTLTQASMQQIICENGFEESAWPITDALKDQTWPLLTEDLTTPLTHAPTMPLTTLQKRWMKALLQDSRIRLFAPPVEGLEEVQPLYDAKALVYYDRFEDGDPFDDPGYIKRFRCILSAIQHKRKVRLWFAGNNGRPHCWDCIPYQLEYSAKDDKFRLISANRKKPLSINLARIQDCHMLEPFTQEEYRPMQMKKRVLVLELTDERNALERVMLHFSYLEKETERLDDKRYKITLRYEQEDEAEVLIRVLSFGPSLKAVAPEDFVKKLRAKLERQKNLRIQV